MASVMVVLIGSVWVRKHSMYLATTAPPPVARPRPWDLAGDAVHRFVNAAIRECAPKEIYWLCGSVDERRRLAEEAAEQQPHGDVLQEEQRLAPDVTTAAWPRAAAGGAGSERPANCFSAKRMFVVAFDFGPCGTAPPMNGILLTDSVQLALRLGHVADVGNAVLRQIGEGNAFIRSISLAPPSGCLDGVAK
jgi:GTP-dependent phosphoenolpyruvate carboxykinase